MSMAVKQRAWTLEMLHALPDDGNKYELVRGDLFVTPAPSPAHETILARLNAILVPYVLAQRLGYVYGSKSVLRFEGSHTEPDLTVRAQIRHNASWDEAPVPILAVEISSPATFRRDRKEKRSLYVDAAVTEYWIVDGNARTITVVRRGHPDLVARDVIRWHPAGATEPLDAPLVEVFGEA